MDSKDIMDMKTQHDEPAWIDQIVICNADQLPDDLDIEILLTVANMSLVLDQWQVALVRKEVPFDGTFNDDLPL